MRTAEQRKRHANRMQAANGARAAAMRRLIAKHRGDWEKFYAEEAKARGVTPSFVNRPEKIRKLKEQLAKLEALNGGAK